MASATVSRLCSKCKQNIGSFNCEGCGEIFCTKHSLEHRQELESRFKELMTKHNTIRQQAENKEQQNKSLKKDLFNRVEDWENNMFAKVRERAEQIRQELDQMIDNGNKMFLDDIQVLTNEIRERHEIENFFERDIDRIQQNINQLQQSIDKSTQQSDIELYVEQNHIINWENLIYIKEKSNTANSSVTNKAGASKDTNGTENTINSYPIQGPSAYISPFYSQYSSFNPSPRGMNPSYIQIIGPLTENGSSTNFASHVNQSAQLPASNSSTLPEKRHRKPLLIVDPVNHRAVELRSASPFVDTNYSSSQTASMDDRATSSSPNMTSETNKTQIQTDFRRQFAKLLTDNHNS